MTAAVTQHDLRRAAIVAREAGVTIIIEGPDGKTFRILPEAASLPPIGATEREADECDKAFGLSG